MKEKFETANDLVKLYADYKNMALTRGIAIKPEYSEAVAAAILSLNYTTVKRVDCNVK